MWTRTTAQGYWQPLTGTGELGAVNSGRNRERREVTVVVARKGDDWGETGGGYWHCGFLLGLHSV